MKVVAIIQARIESTRLPGKVLKTINGQALVSLLLSRLSKSKKIDQIIVATPKNSNNKKLVNCIKKEGYFVYEGSENNVLNRYYEAAQKVNADIIVRITGDCPLVDADLVDECITKFHLSGVDYLSNLEPQSFPDGLDIEVFSFQTLEDANNLAKSNFEKEHVTPYIKNFSEYSKESISISCEYLGNSE